MNKRLLILGLSTYSHFLIEFLQDHEGIELVVVDRNEELITKVADMVHRPVIGNAVDPELLGALDIPEFDKIIISLGQIEASLLCLLRLRELKARFIIVKAQDRDHEHILHQMGVDLIVFPEKWRAQTSALLLAHDHCVTAINVTSDTSIVEMPVPEQLLGSELDVERLEEKFNVFVVLLLDRTTMTPWRVQDKPIPQRGWHLVLWGKHRDLRAVDNALFN
jgi:trk system potassium uptake protein TrkA